MIFQHPGEVTGQLSHLAASMLKPGILLLGGTQYRELRVRILPSGQEVLIGAAGLCVLALESERPSQLKSGDWNHRRIEQPATVEVDASAASIRGFR
jgi:hypothetical protein